MSLRKVAFYMLVVTLVLRGLNGALGRRFWVPKLGTRTLWAASGALSGFDSLVPWAYHRRQER